MQVEFKKAGKCIRWLMIRIHKRIPALLLLAFCEALSSCIGVGYALATRNVIDSATSGNKNLLLHACIILFAMIAFQVFESFYSYHLSERLIADMDRDFKRDIMHRVLHSDYSQISRFHSGDILYRLNSDVSSVISSVLLIMTSVIPLFVGLGAAVIVLYRMAPGFTVVIVVLCVCVALATISIQRYMIHLQKKSSESSGTVSAFLQEVIEKLVIVQALDVSEEIEKKSDEMLETRWQIYRRKKNVSIAVNVGSSFLGYMGSFVTLVWCAGKLLNGTMSFGSLTAMTSLVSQLKRPLLSLPQLLPRFITIFAFTERLMEITEVDAQADLLEEDCDILYEELRKISAEHLSFSYTGNLGERKQVIHDVSFSIMKGGLTVITGPSGIGKSTLLRLFLGIYKQDSGRLLMETDNGQIEINRSARKLFSYAPQGNLLLSGTIRDNIRLSRPDATEEQIREAVYVSAMEEYIAELPNGLDTVLGENGAGLSEGQVQRISLARAVVSQAPILLLDEVTSSLDAKTEKVVLERICALPNRTCIAVTHRPAALELADWELKVSEDRIVLLPLSR